MVASEMFNKMEVHVTCPICKREYIIFVDKNGYYKWKNNGEHIQIAFPELTPGERELLMTGICNRCFDKMFKDEE